MSVPDAAVDFARTHAGRFVGELARLVRFPSVSGQPVRAPDVHACAEWLAAHLASIGLERPRLVATPRHPVVCAEWRRAPGAPTVLVYGHYDVQPAEPLAEWTSPPFEPTRRGDELVGRGASDDKAQLLAHVKAVESYLRTSRSLPVNVVCVFEGEEEIGSPSLEPFLLGNRDTLRAAAAVVSDTTILGPNRPALTYAVRGNVVLELDAHGPAQDLHSGKFGGAVVNPLATLCAIVASLHDVSGRVAVRGFYDRVVPLAPAERAAMARDGPSDAELLRTAASAAAGEAGYSLYERITARPVVSVTGLSGGYTGAGAKSVIPARARAKLDIRLVPAQEPAEVAELVRRHVAALTPAGVVVGVRTLSTARPAMCDPALPAMRAAAAAYGRGFGIAPALVRSGGTVPVIALLQERLGIPTVPMGFGLPDDRWHAPNERVHLPTFARAIETCIWFLAELARTGRPRVQAPPTLVTR
jgi:acetylornithine deacetylase/succinyl-diaminopimelate desuccinylase-like protein